MRPIFIVCIIFLIAAVAVIVYRSPVAPVNRTGTTGFDYTREAGSSLSATGRDDYSSSGAMIRAFKSKIIINPVMLSGDPYQAGPAGITEPPRDHPMATAVCGIRYIDTDKKKYEIRTCRDEAEASHAGYAVTHRGYCGTCSTLQDLAVYLQRRDLTYAVRACSFRIARGPIISCLENIGFSRHCALTWYYNIRNTGRRCLGTCLLSWMKREPLNRADGSLNECLQCDEEMSGPIFKHYAGRTRRNSGIRSEIGRGRGELYPVVHKYY